MANKTYIGSVLFRTSAYTGAKQASRVPFWFRDLSRQNHLVPGHFIPFFRPSHLVPSFIMGFNSLMLFFLCVKNYFLNRLLDTKITFDQMHIGKFCHISCNTTQVISYKRASGRFSFHFREVFQKCIEYIGKFLIQMREILKFW